MIVGPGLISRDLRFNALPLYFSRPLRRVDYFLGKLGVIGFFLAATVVVPAVGAYLLGLAFSLDLGVVRDTHHLLWAGILYGLAVTVSAAPGDRDAGHLPDRADRRPPPGRAGGPGADRRGPGAAAVVPGVVRDEPRPVRPGRGRPPRPGCDRLAAGGLLRQQPRPPRRLA